MLNMRLKEYESLAKEKEERPHISQKNIHLIQQQYHTLSEADHGVGLVEDDDLINQNHCSDENYLDSDGSSDGSNHDPVEMISWFDLLLEFYSEKELRDMIYNYKPLFDDIEAFFASVTTAKEMKTIRLASKMQFPHRLKDRFLFWFKEMKDKISAKVAPSYRTKRKNISVNAQVAPDSQKISFRSWREIVSEHFPQLALPAHHSSRIYQELDNDVNSFIDLECPEASMYRTGRRIKGIPSFLEEKFIAWFKLEIVDSMHVEKKSRIRVIKPEVPVLPFIRRNAINALNMNRVRKKDRLETISLNPRSNRSPSIKSEPKDLTPYPITPLPPLPSNSSGLSVFCIYSTEDGRYLCPKCYIGYMHLPSLSNHIKKCKIQPQESHYHPDSSNSNQIVLTPSNSSNSKETSYREDFCDEKMARNGLEPSSSETVAFESSILSKFALPHEMINFDGETQIDNETCIDPLFKEFDTHDFKVEKSERKNALVHSFELGLSHESSVEDNYCGSPEL